jgi:hypothetical protein
MIMGVLMFEITSAPIRQRKTAFPSKYTSESGVLPRALVKQIIRYVLKAVKKDT